MTKSQEYSILYLVGDSGIISCPAVTTKKDSSGSNINHELGGFLDGLSLNTCQSHLEDLTELNVMDSFGVREFQNDRSDIAEVYSQPKRIVFNEGRDDLVIPLADVIQILKELIDFLNNYPGGLPITKS
jgi:hypothetical protein